MNDLEKRSFYSFLGLYIISSFLFLSLIGYLYYSAKKDGLENAMYYKLEHYTDSVSGEIIMAHMQGKDLKKLYVPEGIVLALIDTKGSVVEGRLVEPLMEKKVGYFSLKGHKIFVSDAPREHLGITYVVAQSKNLKEEIKALKSSVLNVFFIVVLFVIIIAVMLSKLFIRPVRQRVQQIEHFINDVTHELNTPITSLSMATDQALKQGECSTKTMKNISISTKQLYDIYRSLTYLNFSHKKELVESLDISNILQMSVDYYTPLAEIKRIEFDVTLSPLQFTIPESRVTLLFGNLIGNAIKYSSPKSTIVITLKENVFTIKDEGIGIELSKQKEIFQKFRRGTEYSGGFGVGLSIVKSICDEYEIGVELDSALGKGTEFRLMFT